MAEWENGLCSGVCGGDCGTCLGAWFCSCFLHGRTAQRLENFPRTETPGFFDGNCAVFCLSAYCGLNWIPLLMKRGKIRERFGIKGDACTDCLVSCFCMPCSLAQNEMEVKKRAEAAQHGEKSNGYSQPQGGMQYQAPANGTQHPQQGYPTAAHHASH